MSTVTGDPSLERQFRGHKGTVTALSFNCTTKLLASSSLDNNVMIWNLRKATRVFRFPGHKDGVTDICFSPSSNLVASASKDRTARLWVPTLKGDTGEIRAHTAPVRSVDFSPDGKHLVTCSDDKTVKLWAVTRREFVSSFTCHTNRVRCARFSPDGHIVASCGDDKTIKLFDARNSRQCVHSFPETKGYAISLVFHPSGACIGTAMTNHVVKIYDVRAMKLVQHYAAHSGAVNKIAFHPCGKFLLSASQDSTIKVMDLFQGRPLYTLEGHEGAITAVTFSDNGEYFASGGADKKIVVWRSNFDSDENLPRDEEGVKESQPEGDIAVGQVVRVLDSSLSEMDSPKHVVTRNGDYSDDEGGRGDENVEPNCQRSAHGASKSKAAVHHAVCSGCLSAVDRVESDAVVELLVQQVDLLKATVETILEQQVLQNEKIAEIDAKLTAMSSVIESMIDEADDSVKE